MKKISRRRFLKNSTLGTAAIGITPALSGWGNVFAGKETDLVFRPYPHRWMPDMEWAYGTDEFEDPFKSEIKVTKDGIRIPTTLRDQCFSVNTRWFVEGFGYIHLAADNGGYLYSAENFSHGQILNLNYEFSRSRILRNRRIKQQYENEGIQFTAEVEHLSDLSEELFESATKYSNDGEKCAAYADKALKYALFAGEEIELERARLEINRQKRIDEVLFGCETRQYVWAKSEDFTKRFTELFNYATITHYIWDTWYELFEPREGVYNWGIKDNIVNWLKENNITIEGRPLFWFHPVVTPNWLKNKNFDQLKKYVEKHTRDLVGHYGDNVHHWEVVNEYHDWANIQNHTPEQISEITRLACDTTKEANPNVVRIINNCCPWAQYVPWGRMARMDADRPLRSPRKFMEDLIEEGVDFDVLGIQVYFPRRDLSDIVRLLERFEKFQKPIFITEIGASSGPDKDKIAIGEMEISQEPYEWHRRWDEKLQADWLEQVYTLYYSRPMIKSINWYDFSDFRPFIKNGGLIRENSTTKRSFDRLKNLLQSWGRLPG